MDKELFEKIYEIMINCFDDNVEENKGYFEYLKEKEDLKDILILYNSANLFDKNFLEKLNNSSNEEIIEDIRGNLDLYFSCVMKFMNSERISMIKKIAKLGYIRFSDNIVNLDIVKILHELSFIFCVKDEDDIIIHMPDEIRILINQYNKKKMEPKIEKLIQFTNGIIRTYGAISLDMFFEILGENIDYDYDVIQSYLFFINNIELEPIGFDFLNEIIYHINMDKETYMNFAENSGNKIVYQFRYYMDLGNENYYLNLNEYRKFNKFLKECFDVDLNEDEELRDEFLEEFLYYVQVDPNEAQNFFEDVIAQEYFELTDEEKKIFLNFLINIKSELPNWKNNGKINYIDENNNITSHKINRNEKCPCGSGKKYKKCCGKV